MATKGTKRDASSSQDQLEGAPAKVPRIARDSDVKNVKPASSASAAAAATASHMEEMAFGDETAAPMARPAVCNGCYKLFSDDELTTRAGCEHRYCLDCLPKARYEPPCKRCFAQASDEKRLQIMEGVAFDLANKLAFVRAAHQDTSKMLNDTVKQLQSDPLEDGRLQHRDNAIKRLYSEKDELTRQLNGALQKEQLALADSERKQERIRALQAQVRQLEEDNKFWREHGHKMKQQKKPAQEKKKASGPKNVAAAIGLDFTKHEPKNFKRYVCVQSSARYDGENATAAFRVYEVDAKYIGQKITSGDFRITHAFSLTETTYGVYKAPVPFAKLLPAKRVFATFDNIAPLQENTRFVDELDGLMRTQMPTAAQQLKEEEEEAF